MSDNVPVTPGSGLTVATDERTIASTSVHVQRVDEQGSQNIAVGQEVVNDNTASQIVGARDTRKRLVMANLGSVDVYIGPTGVTSSSGFKLKPNGGLTLYTTGAIFAVTSNEQGEIHYIEEYD